MASPECGKYTLEDLKNILSEDGKIWKWTSSSYKKIETIFNEVNSGGKSVKELKKVFKEMERTLESQKLMKKMKPSYNDIKKQLTDGFTSDQQLMSFTEEKRKKEKPDDSSATSSPLPSQDSKHTGGVRQRSTKGERVDSDKIEDKQLSANALDSVMTENKSLREKVSTLQQQIGRLEQEQEDVISPQNLGWIKKKADTKKREQGGAVNDDPVLEMNKKLQVLYKVCTNLEMVCGKAQKDTEQKQTRTRNKESEVKKKTETAVDVDIDKTLADITTSVEHCENFVTSLLKESKETEDQLIEINRKMYEFNCKAKETLSSSPASSPKEPLPKKIRKENRKNVPPETKDSELPIQSTVIVFDECVENVRKMREQYEASATELQKQIENTQSQIENLNSTTETICKLMEPNADKDNSKIKTKKATKANRSRASIEDETEILDKINRDLKTVIRRMEQQNSFYNKCLHLGRYLMVSVEHTDEFDPGLMDKFKEKIDMERKDQKRKWETFQKKLKDLQKWNMKLKQYQQGNRNANVDRTRTDTPESLDDETKAMYTTLQETEKHLSLVEKLDRDNASKLKLLQEELERSEKRINDLQLKTEDREDKISRLKKEIGKISEEKETLLGRLSKIAGTQLASGNPNITDLSDPNRPLKIGEQYSELYDNEWTDAFAEVSENATERECVEALLDVVKKSFEFCRKKADDHLKHIVSAISLTEGTVDVIKFHQIQDLRNIRKIAAGSSSSKVYEDFISKPIKHFKGKGGLKFIQKCIEICWFMAVQNPPLWLHWDVERNDNIDTSLFKSYTNSGSKVDYLVWPALLLHKDGSVIAKGVCQPVKPNK